MISDETQLENACVARAVLKFLNVDSKAMVNFYWPCRMEKFVFAGCSVIIDGCHNGDSVTKFLRTLRSRDPLARIVVLFGAGAEKNVDDMIDPLVKYADSVIITQAKHFKSLSEKDLIDRVPEAYRCKVLNVNIPGLYDSNGLGSKGFGFHEKKAVSGTVAERFQQTMHAVNSFQR